MAGLSPADTEGEEGAGSPHGRVGRPRDDEREEAILDAALELLTEIGYDRMSIGAVAARARASKATIYRRWQGKAELVAAAMRRRVDQDVADAPDTGSLRGDLLAVVELMLTYMAGVDGGLVSGMAAAIRSDPGFGRLLEARLHEPKMQVLSAVVARAQARGELGPGVDPSALVEVGPAVAGFRLMHGRPLDAAFAEHLVDTILIPLLVPRSR